MSYKICGDKVLEKFEENYPDQCSAGLSFDPYKLVAASVRGKMHLRKSTQREDAFAVYRDKNWVAIAVSDGVGSSPHSRFGSSFAANHICQNLLNEINKLVKTKRSIVPLFPREYEPTEDELTKAIKNAYLDTTVDLKEYAVSLDNTITSKINRVNNSTTLPPANDDIEKTALPVQADKQDDKKELLKPKQESVTNKIQISLNDMHCTLLTILLNLKSGCVTIGQIGDGLILGLNQEKNAVPLLEPLIPEQTGETYAITQKDWVKYWSNKVIPSDESKNYITFFLMTDGISDDCQFGPPEDILQRWANDMNSEIRKYDVETTRNRLEKYLNEYEAKGSYDDRTLVVIYRKLSAK